MTSGVDRRLRFVPLAFAAAALVAGLWTGLARIGCEAVPASSLDGAHGALMICGFFGTLISLERAVAIARPWAYAAPVLAAAGAVALLLGEDQPGAVLFILAAAMLTAGTARILLRHPALFMVVLTVAAACWGIGTLVWMQGRPIAEAAGWWLAFLILTIAAERLELSRLLVPPRAAQAAFVAVIALVLAGAARGELGSASAPLTGLGLLAGTAWLVRYDIARRTVRQRGQTRFSAVCLLVGYAWLGITGAFMLAIPPDSAAYSYDAAVHGITLGFVLSMEFGHALIILPAVTGLRVRYHAALYGPLALLHGAVALRIISDAFGWTDPRTISGPLTVLAMAAFVATIVISSLRRRGSAAPAGGAAAQRS
jgi:hypothetical protein